MTDKQRAALEQAAQSWERWMQLDRDQDEWRKKYGRLASFPMDSYESWVDDLTVNAQEALKET